MGKLSMLPNIGKKVEQQLNEVGIETFEQSEEVKGELKEFYNTSGTYRNPEGNGRKEVHNP